MATFLTNTRENTTIIESERKAEIPADRFYYVQLLPSLRRLIYL